jgi:hypothetical protein
VALTLKAYPGFEESRFVPATNHNPAARKLTIILSILVMALIPFVFQPNHGVQND